MCIEKFSQIIQVINKASGNKQTEFWVCIVQGGTPETHIGLFMVHQLFTTREVTMTRSFSPKMGRFLSYARACMSFCPQVRGPQTCSVMSHKVYAYLTNLLKLHPMITVTLSWPAVFLGQIYHIWLFAGPTFNPTLQSSWRSIFWLKRRHD